ncbi:MAG: bifunctional oligoribonuclease/PAP phosphatase NrnA [Candidatus Moranbacteria bacterium]|nr:bifunctional oligoribonuclease/PAP phosphatase NrnA [Candidatus Moranbacteria bacterium]
MLKFAKEFHTLNYAIRGSRDILLFAHGRPDGDTVGSALALKEYLDSLGKNVDIACFDSLPDYLATLSSATFIHPDNLDLAKYKLIIATDSVERGFEKILPRISPDQVTAIIDHHPDITIQCDIMIVDSSYSSVCEMVYNFFVANEIKITREISTYLMLGIIADTGVLQHSNTTSHVLEIISELMKKGAPMAKIINATFNSKKISTLKLWGRAFERARINQENGMITSVITKADMTEFGATTEDIAQVATILNTVPGTKFSLVLSERGDGIIKGSLRSEKYKGVNVSTLAAQFGGGGHELASGFEIKGKIVETESGWKIE